MIVSRQPDVFSRSQQNNIDLLRAIAVISVFIHHAQHVFGGSFPFLGEYGGQFGPQIFFVISGYLICASCDKYSLREYFLHRAFRIFPAYWFYFGLFGIATGILAWQRIAESPWGLLANLSLLQQLFPRQLIFYDVLHVTWTLTVEVLWYLAAPFLIWISGGVSIWLLAASVILSTGISLLASMGHLNFVYPGILSENPSLAYLFLSNHFLVQLCFFLMGGYAYFHRHQLRGWNPVAAISLGILIFLLKPYYLLFNPLFITGVGIFFFLIAGINTEPVRNRIVFWISEISYSIYLCHFPVILFVHERLQLSGGTGLAVAVVVTLLMATASYLLIERPGIRLGRLLAERPRAVPMSTGSASAG